MKPPAPRSLPRPVSMAGSRDAGRNMLIGQGVRTVSELCAVGTSQRTPALLGVGLQRYSRRGFAIAYSPESRQRLEPPPLGRSRKNLHPGRIWNLLRPLWRGHHQHLRSQWFVWPDHQCLECREGVQTVDAAARFSGLYKIPTSQRSHHRLVPDRALSNRRTPAHRIVPGDPAAGPQRGGSAITWGLDDKLKTPYSHVVDFSVRDNCPKIYIRSVVRRPIRPSVAAGSGLAGADRSVDPKAAWIISRRHLAH